MNENDVVPYIQDFIGEVVGEPSFIMCNSVGGVAGLQAGHTHTRTHAHTRTRVNVLLSLLILFKPTRSINFSAPNKSVCVVVA